MAIVIERHITKVNKKIKRRGNVDHTAIALESKLVDRSRMFTELEINLITSPSQRNQIVDSIINLHLQSLILLTTRGGGVF